MRVIETCDLTKHYGSKIGCEKISLSIDRGAIFGFLGPNGAGKSTFVKMMVGLIHATSGFAELLGAPLGDAAARRRLGFLPENFRYQEWLTPMELLAYHGRLLGMEPSAVRDASVKALRDVGLDGERDTKLKNFSKGMQQRFGLASALLSSPEIVFLDEPTSALDPLGRAHVRELLLAARERGTTVFLNSHLLSEVEMVCDEVAVIDHGRIVAAGALDVLLAGECEVEVVLAEPAPDAALAALGDAERGWWLVEPVCRDRVVVGLPAEDRVPELVETLVTSGARIVSVARRKRTLEALFIETVGDESDIAAVSGR